VVIVTCLSIRLSYVVGAVILLRSLRNTAVVLVIQRSSAPSLFLFAVDYILLERIALLAKSFLHIRLPSPSLTPALTVSSTCLLTAPHGTAQLG
jgi:hypothetical protein